MDALAHVRSGTRVELAGRGSLEDDLRRRAAELGVAERLEILGFVDDSELVDRYASALAVVYAPLDEDYGYVTLQAFRAGKPVITASDSGGVLEWVEDGVNGIVTDGKPGGNRRRDGPARGRSRARREDGSRRTRAGGRPRLGTRGRPHHRTVTLPLLALVAGFDSADAIIPLVVAMRPWCRPHALDATLGPPDAYLVASPFAPGIDQVPCARRRRSPSWSSH